MEKYLILTCGGTGKRMNSVLPKQFIQIQGIPILCRTFSAFDFLKEELHVILTLPEEYIDTWQKISRQFPVMDHQICKGGRTRFHSIKNALQLLPDNSTVLIHDGVRPFVSQDTIKKTLTLTQEKGSAVPVSSVHSSLRKVNREGILKPIKRESIVAVQTPQGFDATKLKQAYKKRYTDNYTDDATVYEAAGNPLFFFETEDHNLKITTFADLQMAEALVELAKQPLK